MSKALPRTWQPASYEVADIYAVKALADGSADERQQKRALDWIINFAAQTYDMHHRPDDMGGARDTAFGEGRAFVGQQIVKLIKLSPQALDAMQKKGKQE